MSRESLKTKDYVADKSIDPRVCQVGSPSRCKIRHPRLSSGGRHFDFHKDFRSLLTLRRRDNPEQNRMTIDKRMGMNGSNLHRDQNDKFTDIIRKQFNMLQGHYNFNIIAPY